MRYFAFVILIFLISCHPSVNTEKGNILARVHDKYLYEADLVGVVPQGTSVRDSLILVRNYINNWLKQKLMVHKAEINLTKEQKDFSKQLEDGA